MATEIRRFRVNPFRVQYGFSAERARCRDPLRSAAMNAIKMLEDDHVKVRGLLSELEATTSRATRRRETLLDQIATELRIHTTLEEEIFYPAFKDAAKKSDDEQMY